MPHGPHSPYDRYNRYLCPPAGAPPDINRDVFAV
jgi:hypothetical protein